MLIVGVKIDKITDDMIRVFDSLDEDCDIYLFSEHLGFILSRTDEFVGSCPISTFAEMEKDLRHFIAHHKLNVVIDKIVLTKI